MKSLRLVLATIALSTLTATAAQANYICKERGAEFIEDTYGVDVVRSRVLRNASETEVWCKDTAGTTYSVFYTDSSCDAYKRHVVWD